MSRKAPSTKSKRTKARLVPTLPRPTAEDADMRRFLGCAVVVAAIGAAIAAATADVPDPVPGIALGHPALWRVEVFAAIAVVLYVVIAFIALTFHGWLPTKIDTPAGGAGAQPVTEQSNAISEQTAALDKLTDTVTKSLEDIDRRLSAITEHLGVDVAIEDDREDRG